MATFRVFFGAAAALAAAEDAQQGAALVAELRRLSWLMAKPGVGQLMTKPGTAR